MTTLPVRSGMSRGPHVGLGGKDCWTHDQRAPILIEDEMNKRKRKEKEYVLTPNSNNLGLLYSGSGRLLLLFFGRGWFRAVPFRNCEVMN
jgi:hypothetical protein